MMGMMPPGGKPGMPGLGMPPGQMFTPGSAPFNMGMMMGVPPMGVPAYAKPPGMKPPSSPSTPPVKSASKAIKIVNPKTKQEVKVGAPATPPAAPAASAPAAAPVDAAPPAAASPTPAAPASAPTPTPAPVPAKPAPVNFAAMAAKPASPPKPTPAPVAPKAPEPKSTEPPAPKVTKPEEAKAPVPAPVKPAAPTAADILRKAPEAPKPQPPKQEEPKEPPKHRAVEQLAEAVAKVDLKKSESASSFASDVTSDAGSDATENVPRTRSAPPAITEFTLAEKPADGKYTLDEMKAMRDSPLAQTKPANWIVPDDTDYWPVPGFICPPGVQSFGGGRSGGRRGGSRGGGGYDKKGDDKWAHRQLPADGGRRGDRRGGGYNQSQYRIPPGELPKLHKTDKKYVIGVVDDEEQKRQRAFKAILNKLTPDNFEKLLEKILDVGITEVETLVGLIGQLFEKALQEPTFSSLYAQLCRVLSDRFESEGVEFLDPTAEKGMQAITFKRVLLKKCQQEFESGDKAIARAEAGEDEDDEKKEEEKEGEEKTEEKKELEEGEIDEPPKPKTEEELALEERRKQLKREEKILQARRRMLGNIRFIGELFKKSMLAEGVMHTCIMKLLGDGKRDPTEEDVEALCKLMMTVGGQLDSPKAKAYMDAYFSRIATLSKLTDLSSRHRFMLQDVIDTRSKGWRERRKQEGPKKIEEVHRDAQRQAMEQTRRAGIRPERSTSFGNLSRSDSRRGGGDFERPPSRGARGGDDRGSFQRSDSRSGFGGDRRGDSRSGRDFDARSTIPAPNRTVPAPNKTVPAPASAVPAPKTATDEKESAADDEAFIAERKKTTEYFYDDKDVSEAIKVIATWSGTRLVGFIEYFLTTSFERRDMDWDAAYGLVRALAASDGPMSGAQLIEGFVPLFNNIEDVMCDLPKAGEHIAACVAGPVLDGSCALADVASALRKATPEGEEPGYTLAEGFALTIFAHTLAQVQRLAGDDDSAKMPALLRASGVALADLRGDVDKEDDTVVPKLIEKLGLRGVQ
jgi:translation initiation factor 4G